MRNKHQKTGSKEVEYFLMHNYEKEKHWKKIFSSSRSVFGLEGIMVKSFTGWDMLTLIKVFPF
jgi:hypothetical protein